MDIMMYVVIAAALALVVLIILATKYTSKGKGFDEMQLVKRADAFRAGFFTMLGCVVMLLILENWRPWTERVTSSFSLVAIIMITMAVFGIHCVIHDAFFRMQESRKLYLGLCAAAIFANVLQVFSYYRDNGTLLQNGKVTLDPCGNLVTGSVFLILAAVIIIKMIADRKEEKE